MRNRIKGFLRAIVPGGLAILLAIAGFAPVVSAATNQRRTARPAPIPTRAPLSVYDQGYQKGYDEGFGQGGSDWSNSVPRDFRRSDSFQQRDRSYDPKYSSSEEYQQGFELGFELGYTDGYYGRARNSSVPSNAAVLAKAGALADARRARAREERTSGAAGQRDYDQRDTGRRRMTGPLSVPANTELRIRLSTPISTKTARVGDTFKATVVSPSTYESATVEGHIATLNKSGRVSGKTEMGLAFDSLTLEDGRQTKIDADLVKVYESESVKKVDEEGRVESGSRTRDSQVRGGIGAAAGAILGGIVGGGKGAIIGLVLGGAAGVGTVYVEGNKDLVFDPGTEMVIRTAGSSNPR
jgi:outer membrane lipoprotein SlyB